MAGIGPNFGSQPFGQFGSSGTQAYGMPNAPYGMGQGYNGVPFGYLGAMMGGVPSQYNTSAGNSAKGRGTAPGGPQGFGPRPGGPISNPIQGSGGGERVQPGGPGGLLGGGGGTQGGGLPWTPHFKDYRGDQGTMGGSGGGERMHPGGPGGIGGSGGTMGPGGGERMHPGGPGGGTMGGGNPGKGGFGPGGGSSFGPVGSQRSPYSMNPQIASLMEYLSGGAYGGGRRMTPL